MKTVMYRYISVSGDLEKDWRYNLTRVTSDTKVTPEFCLEKEIGKRQLVTNNDWVCEIIKEIEDDV